MDKLKNYLKHHSTCNKMKNSIEICSCGLDECLQEYDKALADLNHNIINCSLNISFLSDDKNISNNISLIINEVKKFTKNF